MHHLHLALGAVMTARDGWRRPAVYSTVEQEVASIRGAAGLSDISPDAKAALRGSGAGDLVDGAFGEALGLRVGRCALLPGSDSPSRAPVLLARLTRDEMMGFAEPAERGNVLDLLAGRAGPRSHALDLTSALAGVVVTGPAAASALSAVSGLDTSPAGLPNMSCAQGEAAGVHAIFVRADLGELPGIRLYFGREYGEHLWEALLDACRDHGAAPVGLEALARVRTTEPMR